MIEALIAIFATAFLMLLLRAFPFILFSKREPPKIFGFVEKCIPSMAIAALLLYCLKDTNFKTEPFGVPTLSAVALTILLHLWKNNSMISIFGGTILFMLLDYIF